MYRTIKKVLIAVWLLLVVTNVWAQLYPIQVNLTAPGSLPGSIHSLYEANGLKGSIVLLDRYQPTLEVGIGVRIKGNNATIERRSDYLGDPLMLHYGTPVMLGEQVFAPIFQDGITYNGANRDEFERRGALSPGSYEILVWAYDPTRPQVRISNEARCIVWVQQSAPPTLIQPQPNAVVYALPQLFSWTVAQNFPGLNPTKYRFLLYELQDLNRAPESEVLSSEPLYEQELLMPTFAYSTMNAQLTRGKRYAWRIQALAQDMNGREVSLFSNNGFSPVRTFTYGQDAVEYLKKTFEIEPRVSSPYAAEVTWKNVSSLDAPDGMKVEYRKTGASEWQSIEADDEMLTLSQLTPDTEYDIRGIARTGAEYGEAGPVVKFRTQKIPEAKCGPTESYKPDPNSPKLASLVVGDIFTANRVPFVVEEAKGDGTFTGKATSAIPFFGGRKIMFKFSGIALNQKYELLSGSLVADTVGIEKFISKSLQEQNQKLANTLEKKGDLLASEDTKKIDGEIKDATSIKVDTANKQITVTLADGQETIVPFEGKPIIIADSGGKVYSVSDAGAVTSLGMYDGKAAGGATGSGGGVPSAKPQVLSGADLLVAFEAATNQRYGFDDPNGLGGQVWKEKYDEITVGGSKKMVPAKMVAAGSTDVVSVSLKGDAASSDLKDLSFVTSTGMRYTASPSTQKDRLDLTVMGGADASRQELTAWMKKGDSTYAVGRLSIDAYAKKSLRVVLVPVGDVGSAHTAQVATEVARIYRQAGVEVSVTDVPKLPMPEGVSDALKVDKSLMSCYSAGMRSIRSAFTKSETYRKLGTSNVYYLFLVSLPMNGEDENAPFDGYMPYGKPFGFVRSAGMGASELAWTIAHELGHGAFQLQHVWLEPGYDTYTKNLMGYSKTGELFRWQWEHIHHPVPHNNFGADEEDLGATKSLVYYLAPNGEPIGLPVDAKVCFVEDNISCPRGSLKEFVVGGVKYRIDIPEQLWGADQVKFAGYVNKNKQHYPFKNSFKEGTVITIKRGYNIQSASNKQTVTIEEYKYQLKGTYGGWTVRDEVISGSCISLIKTSRNLPCSTCEEQQSQKLSHVVDYSANSKGVSFLTGEELKKLQVKLEDLSKALGHNCKLYIINSSNPNAKNAADLKKKEPEGTSGQVIYDDATKSIQVQLDFEQPEWLSTLAVNGDCQRELVAQAIQKLHSSKIYTTGSTLDKILLEVGTTIYQGMLAVLKCSFGEESSQNRTKGEQYVAGMVFEFGSILNIEDIVTGLIQLGKGSATLVYDSYIGYFKDISSLYHSSEKHDDDNFDELLTKLTPPELRITSEVAKKVGSTSKFLWKYYVKDDVPTKYWRYGQLTAMTIPIVVSVGTWAGAKGAVLVKNLTQKYGAGAKSIASFADEVEQVAKIEPATKTLDDLVKEYGCFTATTPVQTAHGAVPIASITDADQVLSYNHQTGKTELKRIFNIKRHVVKGLLLLGLSTGQTVEATPNHPFYVGGSYREAATLHVGDTLKAANGSAVILQSVARKDTLATVYNFTVADNLNYFVGEPGVLVHNSCAMDMLEQTRYKALKEGVNTLDDDLKGAIMVDLKNADAKLYDALNADGGVDAWKNIRKYHSVLAKSPEALEAFMKLKKNASFSKMGLTDDMVGKIAGWGWGEEGVKVGYAEILNNMDGFISFTAKNNVSCPDFSKFFSTFTKNSKTNKQAIFWILEDIQKDAATFASKTVNREVRVAKFSGEDGFIDIVVKKSGADDLLIEYKWYESGDIPKGLFLDEFVNRDLNNITNLKNLQWRIKGQKLTKEKVMEYLGSSEGREVLKKLGYEKVRSLLAKDDFITELNYVDRFINNLRNDIVFNLIFQ
ncbi:polymorphic toxin-type HINT domain-containing protein [Alistipes sp. ZOR0009]|uniref:polymorphic toxin-type HINT domain-containing protein n=1 Tax=Alistipes sp. ZOR0009 TaxID=1339253 RepID=UPI000645E8D4|nr:polymorphic toxin-type HINT domain-containing protein [Alistipes sp. ZOR0009]